ncbi:M20/M25/M40 family metallo-hydrolase [Arcobacter sp. FWKO B]|uniref:M20/M25/M40 family metallo-hydrolase n=1 Tax=Arcobacter sp. FWKO B TaxID=2593672 RepID=UPI001D1851C3|nr:M20/M25/M40 family metallo-hydrolase [Arcobacter sp. FWKO B]
MGVIDLFYKLTQIPRCSKTHKPFIDFISDFASRYGYIVQIDDAKNVLCKKGNSKSKVCLQSHYDIVCLSDNATVPEIIQKDGYLYAKNSTLGADNGMGCAMMMALMMEEADIEFLFTSDEEIGLLGANAIEFELHSSYMINLDSECEKEICIGCAGGVDIVGTINKKEIKENKEYDLYEITISGLDGGHSGVDIDKNIPNAIKLLAQTIKESNALILDINAGERINSIPKNAKAIVASKEPIKKIFECVNIKKIDTKSEHITILSHKVLDFLYSFANGVREYDKNLQSVTTSINLALVKTDFDKVTVELSARSMDNDKLELIKNETCTLLKSFGFSVGTYGKYPAWKPQTNQLTDIIIQEYKKEFENPKLYAIHAGLECSILKNKYPNIHMASIGPNIEFPHSHNEKVEIKSVEKIFNILKNILQKI